MTKQYKVFLGGTCNNSTWRDKIVPQLEINFFNPVVDDWTPECQDEEIRQRQECDICLYVITSEMTGVYSIAEVVDDSNKRPQKVVFCFVEDGFDKHQIKSLKQVGTMVKGNGGLWLDSLERVMEYLNLHQEIHDEYWEMARGTLGGQELVSVQLRVNSWKDYNIAD